MLGPHNSEGSPQRMDKGRNTFFGITIASLGRPLLGLHIRVEERFSKHRITPRERMPCVNAFSEVCVASVSITCSSSMRSSSSGYLTPIYSTLTDPGHIKASDSRFQSHKLDQCQQIAKVARSSLSRSWVAYIMITEEVLEFFHSCRCVEHQQASSFLVLTLMSGTN